MGQGFEGFEGSEGFERSDGFEGFQGLFISTSIETVLDPGVTQE